MLDQIRDGRPNPNDPLPSARKMADLYGVASMTAQRALRALQNRRITYSVAGYLADQQAITRRFHAARTADDRNDALNDLVRHADAHGQFIDDVIRYQADHGNYAKQPAHLIRNDAPGPAAGEPTAEPPTAKKTRRPRKPAT
ncbi:GntR family transcriptional regulator [Micromonospora sp. SCSIO 07396]